MTTGIIVELSGVNIYVTGTGNVIDVNLVTGSGINVTLAQTIISGDYTAIATTGANLYSQITGLSGQLNETGSNLYDLINNISGNTGNFVTQTQINQSGFVTGTALTQSVLDGSGFITGSIQKVTSLNTLTGVVLVTGGGSSVVTTTEPVISITTHDTGNYLTQTAVDGSGFALQSNLQLTGSNLQSQINSINTISGNFLTGGYSLDSVITVNKIGQSLTISGNFSNYLQTGQTGIFATTTSLNSTGSTLYNLINLISGQTGNYYTKLNESGFVTGGYSNDSIIFVTKNGVSFVLSGNFSSFATVANLYSTGNSLYTLISNISGNTGNFITGLDLSSYSTISFVTGISGVLNDKIGSIVAGVSLVNNLSGQLQVTGKGAVTISNTGNTIIVSGIEYATSGNVALTGSNLQSQITNISNGTGQFITGQDSVKSLNTLISNILLTGLGNVTISIDSQTIRVSGSDITGENNTASNLSESGIFSQKVGADLQFKGLIGTKGIQITGNANQLFISPTGDYFPRSEIQFLDSGSMNLSGFSTFNQLDSTGSLLQSQISDVVVGSGNLGFGIGDITGGFSTISEISLDKQGSAIRLTGSFSDYLLKSETGQFVATGQFISLRNSISTGVSSYFVDFNKNFSTLPVVMAIIEETGGFDYNVNVTNLLTSGYTALFSDTIQESGVWIHSMIRV